MSKITTPVKGYNGKVVGVTFVDGVGETEDEAALSYFARQGYKVEAAKAPTKTAAEKKAEKEAAEKAEADKVEAEKVAAEKAAAEAASK